jgi:hypothetical protein
LINKHQHLLYLLLTIKTGYLGNICVRHLSTAPLLSDTAGKHTQSPQLDITSVREDLDDEISKQKSKKPA